MFNGYEWKNIPPIKDGDFYYTGTTPDGSQNVTAIVGIVTNEKTKKRWAYLFLPAYWRENKNRVIPTLHTGYLEEWTGQWAGPEYGLCCATNQ